MTPPRTTPLERRRLAGVPVLVARAAPAATRRAALWFPGYRASAASNVDELTRIAAAGITAVGVDAVGHGTRAHGDPDDRIPSHPRGALGVMLELAAATVHEVPALVQAVVEAGLANPARVGVVGVSMGGYIAYRVPGTAPAVRTVVALLGSPEWPDDPGSAHLHPADFAEVALLSITAAQDRNVPPAAARAFHDRLAATGHERQSYLELADAEHLLPAADWDRAMRETVTWLGRHV